MGLLCSLVACQVGFDDVAVVVSEHFETSCDGLPCGWLQVAGERGQARYATVDPTGDTGVVLRGNGVRIQGPGSSEPEAVTLQFGAMRLVLTARCDSGSGLGITVAARDVDRGLVDTLSGRVSPRSGELTRFSLQVIARTANLDGGLNDQGGGQQSFIEIIGVSIEKTGDGVCEIGSLEIHDVTSVQGEPSGC